MSEPVYNASTPKGGDPTQIDVNLQYSGVEYNYVYIISCAFIVWLIMPGIGLLYSGLARRKSALALLFQCFLVIAVYALSSLASWIEGLGESGRVVLTAGVRITVQWMFWGYSLAYSRDGGPYIGTLKNFGLMNVMVAPSSGSAVLPEVVFCYFQLLFCACTVIIVIGGAFERGNILPSLIFSFCWATIVYCPLARWTWSSKGWLYNLPSLDYAGGGPVHIASGCTALAYAFVLGKRMHGAEEVPRRRPHNVTLVFLGTVFIWCGYQELISAQGGSTLNASVRSMVSIFNTNTAASTGILGWVLVDLIRYRGRFSLVGACEGAIAGLVGITPAAGFVSLWLAACIGFITSIICALLQDLNKWTRIDEGMDVFKLHGIGGMVGAFLTGIFASESVSALDGATYQGGVIDGVGVQVGRQLAEVCAISGYAFVVSVLLLYLINWIPGMKLRVGEQVEGEGLDRGLLVEEIGDWGLFGMGVVEGARSSGSSSPAQMQEMVVDAK